MLDEVSLLCRVFDYFSVMSIAVLTQAVNMPTSLMLVVASKRCLGATRPGSSWMILLTCSVMSCRCSDLESSLFRATIALNSSKPALLPPHSLCLPPAMAFRLCRRAEKAALSASDTPSSRGVLSVAIRCRVLLWIVLIFGYAVLARLIGTLLRKEGSNSATAG